VHLPEPGVVDAEFALADALPDDRGLLGTDHQARALADARGDDRDLAGSWHPFLERSVLPHGGDRERKVGDRDDAVRARGVGAEHAVGGGMQSLAGAPPGAVGIARKRLDHHVTVDFGHAGESIGQHVRLEGALVVEGDVAVVGPAGPVGRVAIDGCLHPDVRAAVRARLEHPHGLCPPEALLRVIGDPGHDPFAGDRVGHEHHPAVETCDGFAAVGHVGSLDLDLTALHLAHP
jgi:hypothetical protein